MTTLLLQNPLLTGTETRPKPTLPPHNNITTAGCSARKRGTYYISCAGKQDDYHATLKALNSKGRFPRKSLGQHYMLNSEINDQLADAADVKEGDVVLEIGPGTGSLTNVLLDAGATVLAIEKDPHMVALVRERFSSTDRFKVLQEDFVKCHVRSHMSSLFQSTESLQSRAGYAKVVANIPFNISTDVVKQLLPMGDIFTEVVLLLQEETAVRLVEPVLRTSEYRPINIFVNFYSEPEYKIKVPRTNFFPQPKVDAAIVTFKLKQAADYPSVGSTKSFFSMVNSAFNEKRKMLRKSLQHLCTSPEIEEALGDVGLPATVCITNICVAHFLHFYAFAGSMIFLVVSLSIYLWTLLKKLFLQHSMQSRPEELTLDDFVKLHNLITEL